MSAPAFHRRSVRTAAILVAGLLLPIIERSTLAQHEEFSSATLVEGHLEFAPPVAVDWLELAPRGLVAFEIEHPPPPLLSKLIESKDMFDNAEVHFEAQLPADLGGTVFYFISENGIGEVQARRLKGTVRFGLSQGSIRRRTLFGYVVADPPEGSPSAPAGFVLASSGRRVFGVVESTLAAEQLVPADVRETWDELPAPARQFWVIEKQYSFSSDHDQVMRTFVQWAPDTQCYEACCELRYSVFEGVDSPRLLAGYSGQCDI